MFKRKVEGIKTRVRSKLFRKKKGGRGPQFQRTVKNFTQTWKAKTRRNTRLLLGTQDTTIKTLRQTDVPYHLLHANDGRDDGKEGRGYPTEGKGG